MHRAIGLPADAEDSLLIPLQGKARGAKGVGKLRRGVTAEVTNTRGLFINLVGELRSLYPRLLACRQPVVPILAEEAIEGTGLVENSQVFVAIFRSLSISKIGITCPHSPGADPIGYAVGGQRVIIPTNVPLISTGTDESTLPVLTQSTVAFSTLPDKALIEAKAALFSPIIFGRRWR